MSANSSDSSSPIRAVAVAIGLTVAAFVGTFVVGVVFFIPVFALGYDLETTPVLAGAMVVSQLAFFAVGYLYVRRRPVRIPFSRPSNRSLGYVVAGVVVALAVVGGCRSSPPRSTSSRNPRSRRRPQATPAS